MTLPDGLTRGDDGVVRCSWGLSHPIYVAYHDTEWGYPVDDDVRLFEKICLEGFQSGLSWLTILKKRPAFRAAFKGFSIDAVAAFDDQDIARLLQDAGIVRHRGKIEATINNARAALRQRDAFGSLAAYFWQHEPPRRSTPMTSYAEHQSTTPASVALAKDLKARGWRFVGPTTAYAFMQAMGLVNDHLGGCHAHAAAAEAASAFQRPV